MEHLAPGMGRVGRPRSLDAPPCPQCQRTADVVAAGVREVEDELHRSFRCTACEHGFIPGVETQGPTPELRAAVRRVRAETEAPYRLLASALTRHLGVDVSHTTVGQWCRSDQEPKVETGQPMPCEYLSVLWALRCEIQDEQRGAADG